MPNFGGDVPFTLVNCLMHTGIEVGWEHKSKEVFTPVINASLKLRGHQGRNRWMFTRSNAITKVVFGLATLGGGGR